MPGPTQTAEALAWIQQAMALGRYIIDPHFARRAQLRNFSTFDAKAIVTTATECIRYPGGPCLARGTAWRVIGIALDGMPAQVGVEAYRDHLGRSVILLTIMDR